MAFMAAAVPYIMAAGTVIGTIGALNSANAAAAAARQNADINERNAAISLDQGEAQVRQQQELNYRRLSAIRAAAGASGLKMAGSPLDLLESSASQAELDTQNIRYNAKLRALGYSTNADLDRARAGNAQSEGLYRAASISLMGGARAYGMRGTGTPVPGTTPQWDGLND